MTSTRADLQSQWGTATDAQRGGIVREARATLIAQINEQLFPAWTGTSWAFYGTAEYPKSGDVACGYFVSVILRDVGFAVDRTKLAQQASEHIILTMTPSRQVYRYRGKSRQYVADQVQAMGDGLYIIGLDFHVGFLVVQDDDVQMCHSDPNGGMRCEAAATSDAFVSDYRVVGDVLSDESVKGWLEGDTFVTVTK